MIKSIKKCSYEKRWKSLGLLTMKKWMSNLQTAKKAKVNVCFIKHSKGEAKQLEIGKWQ